MNIIIGIKSQYIKNKVIATEDNPLELENGCILTDVTLAYEIYGKINSDKSNVILINHAFTGDSHVGTYKNEPELQGWWHKFVGPGKVFDTTKYAILCSNVLGGCMGSTGPLSIEPKSNTRYRMKFPLITIKDMVNAQKRLLEILGIKKLLSICGGSMGGMQTLQWAALYPEYLSSVIPIATTPKLSPQGIAFNEVGRNAIINDPKWKNGDYPIDDPPESGLSLARKIGHITYLSDESMREKFGRKLQCSEKYSYGFCSEFEVESYLEHQGMKFTKRFDANTYLYLSKSIDYFDLERSYGSLNKAFEGISIPFLIMSFKSDWLYPTYQSKELLFALQKSGADVSFCEIDSSYGHDAFLLEYEKMAPMMINFLNNVYKSNKINQKDSINNTSIIETELVELNREGSV